MSIKSDALFCDSSIVFYGTASIGYRWAVKVLNAFSRGQVRGQTDSFCFLEMMDWAWYQNDPTSGRAWLKELREVFPEPARVSVEDFDRSFELYRKNPLASPRALLRAAVMQGLGIKKIASTFSAGLEHIKEIERTNIMESLKDQSTGAEEVHWQL